MERFKDASISVNVNVDMVFGFGIALEYLKKGYKVARKGWNGKGLHVVLIYGNSIQNIINENYGSGIPEESAKVEDFFMIYSKSGLRLNTWVPSVSDILSEDWQVVKEELKVGLKINDRIYIDKGGNINWGIRANPIEYVEQDIFTINVKATEINEVKNIIASFIFMLEDSRIDRDIRLQYLESCKELKEQYFVRIDK